ncbi:MAG TPA: DUF1854 domain-containing protein [Candidatus Accumulibacter phosphatis]|nr:MAG: hypothetical protein AW07_01043 [Candidatus Accumulibacter sp. SK-11]HAY26340.1 DUF1854 domain-containing protein [Accumulibacter sp.]HCN68108.1 DUF1854 domain-containing protein [Accumulibacter sp.]HRL76097.1 DUF1854 domain-containing protein [Candidatus Accumulibacter phosphatis]HRQ94524.1 DUF1854 domain-containing protein [Candidatus Accumulibacter phosphatis]
MKVRPDYQLRRNSFGRLELTDADGESHDGVVPVRAFPITASDDGLALVDPYGHELAWIDRLDSLPDDLRQLLEDELAGREFMPVIERIVGVGSFVTPSTWEVETDRGPTSFVLKGEEDIRRLASPALLIADSHGIQFLIRDRNALDQNSRRILDRFL